MCRLAQGVSLGSTCAHKSRHLREFGGHKTGCILWGVAGTLARREQARNGVSRGGAETRRGNDESHGLHEEVIVAFPSSLCRPLVFDYFWIVGRAPRGASEHGTWACAER